MMTSRRIGNLATIQDHANATEHFYAVYFTDGKERTAALILSTLKHPFGRVSVSEISRLYPHSEARLMKRLVTMWPVKSWDEAFAGVPRCGAK